VKAFRRARAIGLTIVVMAVVAGASFVGTNTVLSTASPKMLLTAANDFSITSTVSSSSTSQTAALLYPGTQRYLWYTASNHLSVPMTVTSISIVLPVTAPAGCPASNLDLSQTSFSGSLVVPAKSGAVNGTNSVAVPIKLKETGANQNLCQGVTFGFSYTGSARYTEVYGTSTVLASSADPSNVGQSVTYTATVTANAGAGQDPVPSSPTGSVTFYDGTVVPANIISGCSAVGVTSSGTTTSTATCTPTPAYGSPGTHPITAVYSPDSPGGSANFSGSTSPTYNQVVQSTGGGSCVSIATSGPNVTVITGTYTGNYSVKKGQTLWLNGGTITGNVSVDAAGQFLATGGTVKGNVNSDGGPVSLQGTTVGSNLGTKGPLSLGPNTKVSGNVEVKGGNTVCIAGNSSGPVKIGSGLTIQSLSAGATPVTVCNTQVTGDFTYQSNAVPVVIGGSSACTGNTVSGNFTVQNNTAQVTIGASGFGNTVTGKITVQKNTGGGTLTNNSSTTSCSLSGDKPGIVGTLNTAPAGKNTCNATA
jgi:hypothetical protein